MASSSSGGHKVAFVNLDLTAKDTIQREFSYRYPRQELSFVDFSLSDKEDFQHLLVKFMDLKPLMIYFDFTFHEDIILAFLYFFGRDNFFHNIPLIGLSESKRKVIAYRGINIDFVFVKGREVHDMVYAPMAICMPRVAQKSNFAQAKIEKKASLIDDMRVGYVTQDYIHVESNFLLNAGEVVDITTGFPVKNIPSKKYRVKSIKHHDLQYKFKYGYNLEPLFVDRPKFEYSEYEKVIKGESSESMKVKKMIKMKREHHISIENWKERIQISKKRHKEWVDNRVRDPSLDKKAKVLVVDQSMSLVKENDLKVLEKLPYHIYFQAFLKDDLNEIELIRPSVVAIRPEADFDIPKEAQQLVFDIEESEEGEDLSDEREMTPEEADALDKLSKLIDKIKSLENYNPIVLFFRAASMDSKALQETYSYPLIACYGGDPHLNLLGGIVDSKEKKRRQKKDDLIKSKVNELKKRFPLKYRSLRFNDFIRPHYFLDRKDVMSLCSLESEITIYKLTESEMSFFSHRDLPLGNFRINFPVGMSIHIIPIDNDKMYLEKDGVKLYRALIHSIYETDKKFLRQYVNEFFSPDKNRQRQKEEEEYWDFHSKMVQMQERGELSDTSESDG